ncbi:uncharacterized protein LOC131240755 isoform X2 [Magnolia sinica]|uniref:uncharacterized protein LOC131240755 isoform X2 n=1 Tax=Magnolia sinica TaxID=86752 RepID=UPI002659D429|nr:uncharacterized protein LOC131240755 isoform X2 [Magnolia sinica]
MPSGSKKRKASRKKKQQKKIHHDTRGNGGRDDDLNGLDEKDVETAAGTKKNPMEEGSENGSREPGPVKPDSNSKGVSIEHIQPVKGSDGGESYGDEGSSSSSSDEESPPIEFTSKVSGAPADINSTGLVVPLSEGVADVVEAAVVERVVPLSEGAVEVVEAAVVERVVPLSEGAVEVGEAAVVERVVPLADGAAGVLETAPVENLVVTEVKEAEPVQNLVVSEEAEPVQNLVVPEEAAPLEKSDVNHVIESTPVEISEATQVIEPVPVENSGILGGVDSPSTENNDKIPLPLSETAPSEKARDGGELLKESENKEQQVVSAGPLARRSSWMSCCGLFDAFLGSHR